MHLTDHDIDAALLAVVPTENVKVALAILRAAELPGLGAPSEDMVECFAERTVAPVECGELVGHGLLDRWRHSEVKR